MADRLSELIRRDAQDALREGWACEIAGREIYCLVETSSTNHVALNLARQGALEGTVVVADAQSAGRGRLGRAWLAPPGTSLLFSIVLRPRPGPPPFQTVMAVALGVVRGLAAGTGLEASLKWPNDLLLGGRKAGGLLAEGEAEEGGFGFMVVGVGLNVNFYPRRVAGIPAEATSILEVLVREVDRCALLRHILQAVDEEYALFRRGVSPHARWAEALATLGKEVVVELAGDRIRGRAERADENGALWILEPGGSHRRILAGDVTHLRTVG
ncbi:MAG: biotin--[acetyl-CoA-carboxylase] ligase [Chloroflexi bacterium]|nr:biotin--[acetyl-CoA-carboxylase] ligase [Chloroflexota bacterium]